MIEEREGALWLVCDGCGEETLWREKLLRDRKFFPKGWLCYKEFNVLRAVFCPRSSCQEMLNLLDPYGHDTQLLVQTDFRDYPLLMGQLRTKWGQNELEKALKSGRKTRTYSIN